MIENLRFFNSVVFRMTPKFHEFHEPFVFAYEVLIEISTRITSLQQHDKIPIDFNKKNAECFF